MAIVSLADARRHLRITVPDFDAEITDTLEQANAIVLVYIQDQADEDWTADTDPAADVAYAVCKSAILEVLANIWRHRGDADDNVPGPFTDRVKDRLYAAGLRVPSLA
jgi:hypothetical protein